MSEAFLGLKLSSWENLFEVIRDKDTQLNSKGNFWAAIQHLEEQFETAKREAEYRERTEIIELEAERYRLLRVIDNITAN